MHAKPELELYPNLFLHERNLTMKRGQVFPSTYLGKEDVLAAGGTIRDSVGDVRMETVKGEGGDEEKAVLHFAKKDHKPMIINNTNWTTLEEAYGDDSDLWHGKPVEVYVDPGVMFGGKRVGGVRLRVPPKNGQAGPGPLPVWTLTQAINECLAVGISKAQVLEHLKKHGRKNWTPSTDTPLIRALIEERMSQPQAESLENLEADPLPEPPANRGEEEIPF
jgi:hypothetical protein